MKIFKRYRGNPILIPDPEHYWEDEAVFNPGAVFYNGKFHLLYRAIGEYDHYVSFVGHAESKDGIHFQKKSHPAIKPEESYEKFGIEDLRINPLEGKYYLTHTALAKPATKGGEPHQVGLIRTENFVKFERMGVITPPEFCSRNAVLFPEKIGNDYVLLHRPLYLTREKRPKDLWLPKRPGIWLFYSPDFKNWQGNQLLMEPLFWWEKMKIGAGPPPIKTSKGWLLIYHGMDEHRVYRAGAALLDMNDPSRVLARTEEPILEPKMDYEIIGDTPNVVFPTGLILKDGLLYLYYGAADNTCCLATVGLKDFLENF